jgi:hypothetical protein
MTHIFHKTRVIISFHKVIYKGDGSPPQPPIFLFILHQARVSTFLLKNDIGSHNAGS